MTENIFTPHTDAQTEPQAEPTLRRNLGLPKGVLQKNLKTLVYLGAALLVIVAALFSSSAREPSLCLSLLNLDCVYHILYLLTCLPKADQ